MFAWQVKGNERFNDDDSFDNIDNSPGKGVSKEHSSKAHSSEMFNLLNLDPVVHYLHACLIKNQLLESFASDMPEDYCGGSATSNLAGCLISAYDVILLIPL